jgi:flavin-dependent thymidylate synthase
MAHQSDAPHVQLAGCTVDLDQLRRVLAGEANPETLTPESVAAAYGRLSRRTDPLRELRAEAAADVERARKSMANIVHAMGHQSIAEHAVFNIDFGHVSRLAVELIEMHRLASYTERSQRYVKFKADYLAPPEVQLAGLADEFVALYRAMFAAYDELHQVLRPQFLARGGDPAQMTKGRVTELENLAKEDARYVIGLATQTSVGATFNGRELELLIRRLLSHPAWEAQHLGRVLKDQVQPLAPSLVKYCDPCDFFETLRPIAAEAAGEYGEAEKPPRHPARVDYFAASAHPDEHVIAALLFQGGLGSFAHCLQIAQHLRPEEKKLIYLELLRGREIHDNVSRHFELPQFTFGLTVSASLYAQLKRHRLSTQIVTDYDPDLGLTVPPSVRRAKREKSLRAVAKQAEALYEKILTLTRDPFIASYALTNAHRRRVLVVMNLREVYHFAKERMAQFAQWDIRETAGEMAARVREAAPITAQLLLGKDVYPQERHKLLKMFGLPE